LPRMNFLGVFSHISKKFKGLYLIPFTQRKVAILEYHDLSSDRLHSRDFHSPYVLPANIFRGHMEWLQENGYNALTIDRLFEPSVPEKSVVLTFDDGHISNYEFAYLSSGN